MEDVGLLCKYLVGKEVDCFWWLVAFLRRLQVPVWVV